jgi:glycosyltransferase involved in cell wall biosynthesis
MNNTKTVTVAIVIPAYNEAETIIACLESIAAQTVMPDEVILVDNNSSDATVHIAGRYPFVRVVSEPRQGIVHARNRGFDSVQSDIIGRIDADTRLKPGWVEHVKHFYGSEKNAYAGLTGPGNFYNVRWPKFAGRAQQSVAFQLNRLIMGGYILWGSNMAVPRVVWEEVRVSLHERNDIHEDIDLAIHMRLNGFEVKYRKSLLVSVRMRRFHTEHQELWSNLKMWPRTFHIHGYFLWPVALAGSVLVYFASLPASVIERFAIVFGKPPLLKRRLR